MKHLSLTVMLLSFLPLWEDATTARYWITFFVFSVFPAPDSPLKDKSMLTLQARQDPCGHHHHSQSGKPEAPPARGSNWLFVCAGAHIFWVKIYTHIYRGQRSTSVISIFKKEKKNNNNKKPGLPLNGTHQLGWAVNPKASPICPPIVSLQAHLLCLNVFNMGPGNESLGP